MKIFSYLLIILAVVLLLPVLFLRTLSPEDKRSDYPKDTLLVERFNTDRDLFEKLEEGDHSDALKGALHIDRIDGSRYTVWFQDIVATGYCAKGYLFSKKSPGKIVQSIDDAVFNETSRPCSAQQLELYRPLEDHWYLFYHSVN